MKDKLPIMSEVAEDKLFREYIGEISKHREWDKQFSDVYTDADRKEDLKIKKALEGGDGRNS